MKIAKYIPAAAIALVLAGCQSEDDFVSSGYANDPMAVHIRAGIEALQTRVNTTGTGDAWEDGDLISVANTSAGAVTGKNKAVYKYNYNSSAWEPSGAEYMVWADDVNTFEAYYPVVEGKTDSYTQFELPTDQSSNTSTETNYIGRADYMTATEKQSKSDALNLTFSHHLAKVTVTISGYGDQYATQKPTFTAPTFTVPTTPTEVTGKTLTVAGSGTTVTGLFSEDETAEAKHSFTAVLLPGKYATDDTFVLLNIEGGSQLIVKANEQLTTTGLESGKAYTFNVTVGKDGATISSVTVTEWGNGSWTENGTANVTVSLGIQTSTAGLTTDDGGYILAD
ncbi:fimbrillin family protein [uncultured Alistipes sp.]|uniref:fimbrillin family protein n=1 Tax=uncultured Alistipes sp. TaxID=538949 RepID=UPI00266BC1A3|nr:fimbrillin family protein [uncultured Alistipes sp.]